MAKTSSHPGRISPNVVNLERQGRSCLCGIPPITCRFSKNATSFTLDPTARQGCCRCPDPGQNIDVGQRCLRDGRCTPAGTGESAHEDRAIVCRPGEHQRPLMRRWCWNGPGETPATMCTAGQPMSVAKERLHTLPGTFNLSHSSAESAFCSSATRFAKLA